MERLLCESKLFSYRTEYTTQHPCLNESLLFSPCHNNFHSGSEMDISLSVALYISLYGKIYFVQVFLNIRNHRGLRNVIMSAVFSYSNEGKCSKTVMLGFVFCLTSTLSSPFLNMNASLNANIFTNCPIYQNEKVCDINHFFGYLYFKVNEFL